MESYTNLKIGFSLPHIGSIATPENIVYAGSYAKQIRDSVIASLVNSEVKK